MINVVICTHNPRDRYLTRVLAALRAQTLDTNLWELLVVDNASREPLSDRFDLGWHPHARHVRELELGLTPTRIRGIKETSGDVIVFVDDDNVLDPNYLEQAVRIGAEYPFLGVWGGSAVPEFEVPPESWAEPYFPFLAIREVRRDVWSNLLTHNESVPNGAGLCVRRAVAEQYVKLVNDDIRHKTLDRRGADLLGGGDHAIVFTGCKMGLGSGSMKDLRLTHLIPADRLTKAYLLKMMERYEYSYVLFSHLFDRDIPVPPPASPPKRMTPVAALKKLARKLRRHAPPTFASEIWEAQQKGRSEGLQQLAHWRGVPSNGESNGSK